MHILLVDDDSFLRDMYATKFTESGHTVSAAASGEEGLQVLKDKSFDVVLLDMVMPGMSGIELLQQATTLVDDATKFVVLSNQGEDSDKTAAKEAGAMGYIVKAESIPSEVVTKVEAMISK
ncbi:MAG: response regulator transcription factor [Bacteroidota bacterium]